MPGSSLTSESPKNDPRGFADSDSQWERDVDNVAALMWSTNVDVEKVVSTSPINNSL